MMKAIFTFPFVLPAHKNNSGYREGVYPAQIYFCSLTIMTRAETTTFKDQINELLHFYLRK